MHILYEDNHLLVVEKPPNVPTQADASGDLDLLSQGKAYIKEKCQKPGAVYLGLVHRLDRPVGGAMVFARTSKAAARLAEQLRAGRVTRRYLCVAEGGTLGQGEMRHHLLKDEATNTSRVVHQDTPGAKEASLAYRQIAFAQGLALAEIELFTGRSHQIRVQMSATGHPLWGDMRYGQGEKGRQIALFAHHLAFAHPTTKEPLCFALSPPEVFPWSLFPR